MKRMPSLAAGWISMLILQACVTPTLFETTRHSTTTRGKGCIRALGFEEPKDGPMGTVMVEYELEAAGELVFLQKLESRPGTILIRLPIESVRKLREASEGPERGRGPFGIKLEYRATSHTVQGAPTSEVRSCAGLSIEALFWLTGIPWTHESPVFASLVLPETPAQDSLACIDEVEWKRVPISGSIELVENHQIIRAGHSLGERLALLPVTISLDAAIVALFLFGIFASNWTAAGQR